MKLTELQECLMMLGKIREDQQVMLENQRKILSELADVKSRQKRLEQEMDDESMEWLSARNGFIN